jgi:hypothetical protein
MKASLSNGLTFWTCAYLAMILNFVKVKFLLPKVVNMLKIVYFYYYYYHHHHYHVYY